MKIVFAGPSLARSLDAVRKRDPRLVIAGPAICGDVLRAVNDGATVIGLVDGCFEHTRSVWHKEILHALSLGVAMAGAASMGALRAAECSQFGMIGIGRIYESYASGERFDDSDVALVHAPAELGYEPLSEPRVNVLATLSAMLSQGLLSPLEHQAATAAAGKIHYAELTHAAVINATGIADLRRVQRLISWANLHRVDVKARDAMALIEWIARQPDRRGAKPDWEFGETSQWRALVSEIAAAPSIARPA